VYFFKSHRIRWTSTCFNFNLKCIFISDSDGSIPKEPVIKSLAEKCSAKNDGERSKRLKIHHRNSRDGSDGKDCEEDGRRSHLETRLLLFYQFQLSFPEHRKNANI